MSVSYWLIGPGLFETHYSKLRLFIRATVLTDKILVVYSLATEPHLKKKTKTENKK